MPGGWGWLVVVALIVADFVVIGLVVHATVGQVFRTLAERHPPRPSVEPAVRKSFQSFRFGLINAGLSVHLIADERHLHVRPVRVLRWLGARDSSVRWEAIEPGARRGRYRKAKIGSLNLVGPAWALDLADAGTGGGAADTLEERQGAGTRSGR